MLIRNENIQKCLDKAGHLADKARSQYLEVDVFPRSIQDFQDICNQEFGRPIPVRELHRMPDKDKDSIKAFFIRAEGIKIGDYGAVWNSNDVWGVYLQFGQNHCWKRFCLCKELFHAILDGDEVSNMEIMEHIERTILPSAPNELQKIYPAGESEWMAEIAAMEYLFPYGERIIIMSAVSGSNQLDTKSVAEKYKVPQRFVEQYLSQAWMDFLGPFAKKI